MSIAFFAVAAGYIVVGASVLLFEVRRVRHTGPDVMTMFVVLCLLQCCIPGVVIFGSLPLVDAAMPTGVEAFDKVLRAATPTIGFLTLALTCWFVVFCYVGLAVGHLAFRNSDMKPEASALTLSVRPGRLLSIIFAGLTLTLVSFYLLSDSLVGRYTNLVLLRAGFEGVERSALNANAFALTQAWSWLSVVALLSMRERRAGRWLMLACALSLVVFALLGVSRRALFLPLLLIYLGIVLYNKRWRFGWILFAMPPLLLLVAFGKDVFAAIAWNGSVENVQGAYLSWASGLLRAACDIGITITESLGTLTFLDIPPRFGVDHVLSIAQRFPDGMLGFQIDFPERIVRVSTTAMAGVDSQDLPPGLLGQMWLDFRLLGPVLWGLVFGLQVSLLQHWFTRTVRTAQAAAVFTLLVFIVALPINSGSFDFTFSVDIVAVLLALAWSIRIQRAHLSALAGQPAAAAELV